MPRRAHAGSGDEDSTGDRNARVVAKPCKRRRLNAGVSFRPRGIVNLIQEGDQRLIRKLFRFLQPEQVFALSFTCRVIRSFLRSDSAAALWRHARNNAPGPSPPLCPPGMTEMSWTELLFMNKCHYCWARTTREVDWGLRRRFCSECKNLHVRSQVHMPKTYKDVSEDVFRLVPYSRVARSGVKTQYYWEPELDEVHRELKRLDQRVAAGKADAREQRSRYILNRKRYVDEVLDAVSECRKWQKECKDRQREAQDSLRARVVAKFVELGYPLVDVREVLQDVRITESSLSCWTSFLKKHSATLDARRQPLMAASSVELVRSEYRRFLKTYAARGWETLVPFGDIICLPDVKSHLRKLALGNSNSKDILDLVSRIPSIVESWREDVESELLETLPVPKGVRRVDASLPDRLKLASSIWRRADDPTPLSYPNMLLVSHVLSLEHGELKYATAGGPWSMKGLRYDEAGASVVRQYCQLASLNYATATGIMLDDSALRLQCRNCKEDWPLVLSWRQAIKHLHEMHPGQGSGSWKPHSSAVGARASQLEAEMPIWSCTVCRSSRKLRTVADTERHLSETHSIVRASRGEHYARTPTAPLFDPWTLLQLHLEEAGESAFHCRYCEFSASLPSALTHLGDRHDVVLRSSSQSGLPPMPPPREDSGSRSRKSITHSIGAEDPGQRKRNRRVSFAEEEATLLQGTARTSCSILQHAPLSPPASPRSPILGSPAAQDRDPLFSQDTVSDDNDDESSSAGGLTATDDDESSSASDEDVDDTDSVVYAFKAHQQISIDRGETVDMADGPPSAHGLGQLLADSHRLYSCARCPRAVDRMRRFKPSTMQIHLAKSHSLAEPILGQDYAVADDDVDETLSPWCQQPVYTCKLCEGSSSGQPPKRLRWSQIDSHLFTCHKVLDPVGGRDYERHPLAHIGEAADNRATGSADHKQKQLRNTSSRFPMRDADALTDIYDHLGIRIMNPFWKAFECMHCKDRRQLNLRGLLQHLASKHFQQRARVGIDYVMCPELRKNAQSERFVCKLCSSSNPLDAPEMHNHLTQKHGLRTYVYGEHCILLRRNRNQNEDGESDCRDSTGETTDDSSGEDGPAPGNGAAAITLNGSQSRKRRKPNCKDTRKHFCQLCPNNGQSYLYSELRTHLDRVHEINQPVFREHFLPMRGDDGRAIRKKPRLSAE